jgi:uncharacterized protein
MVLKKELGMKHYFYRLNSPRPTFPGDITPEEGALMGRHAAYWQGLMAEGKVVAIGPVADPKGFFGVGILALADDEDPAALVANDPAVKANAGFSTDIFVMPRIMKPG